MNIYLGFILGLFSIDILFVNIINTFCANLAKRKFFNLPKMSLLNCCVLVVFYVEENLTFFKDKIWSSSLPKRSQMDNWVLIQYFFVSIFPSYKFNTSRANIHYIDKQNELKKIWLFKRQQYYQVCTLKIHWRNK